jgi:VIT1/CCC1 family predicted Fe2+/Mn2+ transporter
MTFRQLVAPSVFGVFDGMTTSVGVILGAISHPAMILPSALAVGVAGGAGMAGGELESNADSTIMSAIAIGISTTIGTVLPAIPFAFGHSIIVMMFSLVAVLLLSTAVAGVAAHRDGWRRAATHTALRIVVVSLCVAACTILTNGSA